MIAGLYEQFQMVPKAVEALGKIGRARRSTGRPGCALPHSTPSRRSSIRRSARLKTLVAEKPDRIDAALTLADLLRGKEKYSDAVQAYDTAIMRIRNLEERHWSVFFGRGIVLERTKQWPKAEADMKKALELSPEQPHVLNYLGYSWIDQGLHLDEGMKMLQRATELRPDDGAITNSVGWAFYRLGQYDKAVGMAGARRRAEGRRRHHHRASRRCLLACRPQARGALPMGAGAQPEARQGPPAGDQGQARERAERRQRQADRLREARRSQAGRLSRHDGADAVRPAHAKVNLWLNVVGRRERRLSSARIRSSLSSTSPTGRQRGLPTACRSISMDRWPGLAGEADNLVLKAARLLADRAGVAPRAAIRLVKHVPVAAGLGGGSADAAATLRELVELWRVAMPEEELFDLAARLGADVPMCLAGRTAFVSGIGERLEPGAAVADVRRPAGQSRHRRCRPATSSPRAAAHSRRCGRRRARGGIWRNLPASLPIAATI